MRNEAPRPYLADHPHAAPSADRGLGSGEVRPALRPPRRGVGTGQLVVVLVSVYAPGVLLTGGVPTIYQFSGSVAVPLVIAFAGAVVLAFSLAYAAMTRRLRSGGGLYVLIAAGLGPVAGVAGAVLALVSYLVYLSAAVVLLAGALRGVLFAFFEQDLPLWMAVLWAAGVTLAGGLLPLRVAVRVLGAFCVLQLLFVGWFEVAALTHPDGGSVSFQALDPASLLTGSFALAACLGLSMFVGAELGLSYSGDVDQPARAIPRATTLAYLIVTGVLVSSTWALSVVLGPENIVAIARDSFESLTGARRDPLLVEGVAAATNGSSSTAVTRLLAIFLLIGTLSTTFMLSQSVGRQLASMARHRLLPTRLGTRRADGTPTRAVVALGVLCGVVAWVAVVTDTSWMTFTLGLVGGLGVTLLLTLTALAIIVWFLRRDDEETGFLGWEIPFVAGAFSAVVTGFVYVFSLVRLPVLLGDDDAIARWLLPVGTLGAVAAGVVWALVLRSRDEDALRHLDPHGHRP